MAKYDDLLQQARENAEAYRSTARKFIPQMYLALRNEDPNFSPGDARDKIEKDCVGMWSKRTILDALPDEAKNPEKQKAGHLRQKEHNSAAVSAANPQKEEIIIDTYGRSITDSFASTPSQSSNKGKIKSQVQECPGCLELQAKVTELSEALLKDNLNTANDMILTSTSSCQAISSTLPLTGGRNPPGAITGDLIDFEFRLEYRNVQRYMAALFRKKIGHVWFCGKIDRQDGKIIDCRPGKIQDDISIDNDDVNQ